MPARTPVIVLIPRVVWCRGGGGFGTACAIAESLDCSPDGAKRNPGGRVEFLAAPAFRFAPCGLPIYLSMPGGGIRIEKLPRFELGRIEDHLAARLAELVDAGALDMLVLDEQHPALLPLAVVGELDVTDDGREFGRMDVGGDLGLV